MNNTLWENAQLDLFLSLAWFGNSQVILVSQYVHLSVKRDSYNFPVLADTTNASVIEKGRDYPTSSWFLAF